MIGFIKNLKNCLIKVKLEEEYPDNSVFNKKWYDKNSKVHLSHLMSEFFYEINFDSVEIHDSCYSDKYYIFFKKDIKLDDKNEMQLKIRMDINYKNKPETKFIIVENVNANIPILTGVYIDDFLKRYYKNKTILPFGFNYGDCGYYKKTLDKILKTTDDLNEIKNEILYCVTRTEKEIENNKEVLKELERINYKSNLSTYYKQINTLKKAKTDFVNKTVQQISKLSKLGEDF